MSVQKQRDPSLSVAIWVIVTFLFVLAFIGMAFNKGVFWDDWTIYNVDLSGMMQQFKDNGNVAYGWLFGFLNIIAAPTWLYRVIMVLLYAASALCTYKVLKAAFFPQKDALLIATLGAVFPINFARISITNLAYAVSFFLFWAAFYILTKWVNKRKIIYRISALFLFFCSFTMNSLLVFFIAPLLYLLYFGQNSRRSFRGYLSVIIHHIEYFVLPLAFWIVKTIWLLPKGIYDGYNSFSSIGFLNLFVQLVKSPHASFFAPLNQIVKVCTVWPILFVLLSIILIIAFRRERNENTNDKPISYWVKWGLFGMLLFIAGVFPYIAVNKIPSILEWNSRHQILTGTGSAIILYSLISIVTIKFSRLRFLQEITIAILIVGSTLVQLKVSLDFERDWFKQCAVMDQFLSNPIIQTKTSFAVHDLATNMNAIGRTYRDYEYCGQFKYLFKDETRFASISSEAYKSVGELIPLSRYSIRNFKEKAPEAEIEIASTGEKWGALKVIQTIFYQWFSPSMYKKSIQTLCNVIVRSK